MNQRRPWIVLLVFLIFFVISFLTNILGPLIPDIISSFRLSLGLAGFLPFAFFVAFGVMSIPAGMLLERFREKPVMIAAFASAFGGSLLFATTPKYEIALVSLFLIGIGMTMLQVAINPLLRVAGGEEHFAANSVAAQLVFGAASFISPFVYSYLVTHPSTLSSLVPRALPWVSLYWVFSAVTLLMVIVLGVIRLPRYELAEGERIGPWTAHRDLLRRPVVHLYFIGIFCYVGTEQGIANWTSKFLATYHGFNPQAEGARAVAMFWGLMTVGCLLGLVLLKLFDGRKVLIGFAAAAILTLTAALGGGAALSYYSFMSLGFFLSVMWSVIFSLALNSVERHHGSFSGILCTAIVGGAFVSLAIGWLGERVGLRAGMLLLYATLVYILSIGFWARPLVDNATVSVRDFALSVRQAVARALTLVVLLLLCACATGGTRSGSVLFDDFSYASTAELAPHGWILRTAPGWPGVPGALWGPESFSLNDGVLRMTATTSGVPAETRQSQLCHQRKFLDGTYAARVRFTEGAASGPNGDQYVQSFYLISPIKAPMDRSYAEVDFEYLANGGWGTFKPTLFSTTWDTFQLEPWIADRTYTNRTGSVAGWHTLVMHVDRGATRYFVDGQPFAEHRGRVYTEMLSLNFNLWFIRDQLQKSAESREYQEEIDWVYFRAGQTLSPPTVEAEVAGMRRRGVAFVDTVPASGLESPCNF